jgi:hypothetical protein
VPSGSGPVGPAGIGRGFSEKSWSLVSVDAEYKETEGPPPDIADLAELKAAEICSRRFSTESIGDDRCELELLEMQRWLKAEAAELFGIRV